MFQNKLFYNVLYKYISNWCKDFRLLLEVIGEFESTLEEFQSFFVDVRHSLHLKMKVHRVSLDMHRV